MGCGASTAARGAPEARHHQQNNRNLNRTTSKLGSKEVVNSFVVAKAKARARNRESDSGVLGHLNLGGKSRSGFDRLGLGMDAIREQNQVESPSDLQGYPGTTPSGLSFKMACSSAPSPAHPVGSASGTRDPNVKPMAGDLGALREKLLSSQDEEVLAALSGLREQLSDPELPVAEVRQHCLVPRLIELLNSTNSKVQHEAAWALTQLCSGDHAECQDVVDHGAVPALVGLLTTRKDQGVLQQALWALGNIAADCPELQQAVLDQGVLQPVLQCMHDSLHTSPLILRQAAWLISNLCRPKTEADSLMETVPVLELFIDSAEDEEALLHICWALAYISGGGTGTEVVAGRPKLLRQLVNWLRDTSCSMAVPSLRTLGNLCSGSNTCTQAVVCAGGVPAITSFLKASVVPAIRKECVWSLSNIAVTSCDNVKLLADIGAFKEVISLLDAVTNDDSMRRECAYVLANAWSGTDLSRDLFDVLLQQQVVQGLAGLLQPSTPANVLQVALQGLQDAVKMGKKMAMPEGAALAPGQALDNPVATLLKELDVSSKLDCLRGDVALAGDTALMMKLNALGNVLV